MDHQRLLKAVVPKGSRELRLVEEDEPWQLVQEDRQSRRVALLVKEVDHCWTGRRLVEVEEVLVASSMVLRYRLERESFHEVSWRHCPHRLVPLLLIACLL